MRLRNFCLIGFAGLLSLSAVLLFQGASSGGIVTKAAAAIKNGTCPNGTVSSYIGTSCSQGLTTYNWQSYTCTSSPQSICDSLGINGSNVKILLDPNGPQTLLIGDTRLWNVTAGQSVDVVIKGTVSGAIYNQNWPHFLGLHGRTGDGVEDNKTTVDCATRGTCTKGNGTSEILCNATAPPAYCADRKTINPYLSQQSMFAPATLANPYPLTIEVYLYGGTNGTASLYNVGLHVGN
jgi:hypothetical protein